MNHILKGFKIFTLTYHFYQNRCKLKNATSLYWAHKNFEIIIESWINTKEGA